MASTDRTKSILIATACCGAAACIGIGVGCYYGGYNNGTEQANNIMSYVSTDTAVASSTAEVVECVANTVVEIRTESVTTSWGHQYIVSGAGSGVIVGDDKNNGYYIVTNNHVIAGAENITVTLKSGQAYPAVLVATDEAGDIAVVKIEEEKTLPIAMWGNSDELKIGEDLIAIGNPLGSLGGTVTKGILSATERNIAVGNYTMTLLQTDTAINPGNSGGGLFNMRKQLIGVVNAKTSDEEVEGICFAIPANTALSICADLIENGVVTGRVDLGIEVEEGSLRTQSGTSSTVYVTAVANAESGTFEQYDKIAEINGIPITTMLSYNDAVATLKPGDDVNITVYRGELRQGFGGPSISFSTTPTNITVKAKQAAAK